MIVRIKNTHIENQVCLANIYACKTDGREGIHCGPALFEASIRNFVRMICFYVFREMLSALALWIQGIFFIQPKCAKIVIVINHCTAEPGYWQKHTNMNLVTNVRVSLLICNKPLTQ